MTSCAFPLKVAQRADIAKAGAYDECAGSSFGNMNVILLGDFYQFPLVTGKLLYETSEQLNEDERLGQALFEQFDNMVILHDQVRTNISSHIKLTHIENQVWIQDPKWLAVLRAT